MVPETTPVESTIVRPMLLRATCRAVAITIVGLVVVGVAGPVSALVPDVDANVTTNLGWQNFRSMVVDSARSQLILSGANAGGGELKFVDYAGSVTSTLTGVGMGDMVVDGSTLYLLSPSEGTITPINLTSKTVGTAITSSLAGSEGIGYAGGYLWTNYNTGLQRVNKSTGAITTYSGADFPPFPGSVFATNPTDANELAVSSPDIAGGIARIYDVSTFPPTLGSSTPLVGYSTDVRYTPDGSSILLRDSGNIVQLSSTDLSVQHSYQLSADAAYGPLSADATDMGGLFVAGGAHSSNKVKVFPEGQSTPNLTGTLYGSGSYAEVGSRGGVRFSPTGDRLFVVTYASAYYPDAIYLQVFLDPTHFGSSTTMTAPSNVSVLTTIQISGVLTFADGVSVDPGETVDIERRVGAGTDAQVGSTVTTTAGAWTFYYPTTAADVGNVTFTATFPGNAMHRGTSSTASVLVSKIKPTLSLGVSKKAITVGGKVSVSVHLGLDGSAQNRKVQIYGSVAGHKKLVGTVTVNDSGNGSLLLGPIYSTKYEATSTGDPLHVSVATAGKWVGVHAMVTGTLAGNYATSSGVRLFHRGVNPKYTVHVDPNETHFPMIVYLDVRSGSRWVKVQYSQFELQSGSKIVLAVNGAKLKRGVLYRISASFQSDRNLFDWSPWVAFKVP
jgi:hypothetical protein